MEDKLTRLVRELRKERCPRRVHDEVSRRISAQASRPSRLRYAIPAAVAGLVLLGCFAVWRRPAGGHAQRRPESARQAAPDGAQIAQQAEEALGYIGSVLLDAGTRSEKVISDKTVPPLRNGLERAKNKILHPMEL